jgi:hypothetical protein
MRRFVCSAIAAAALMLAVVVEAPAARGSQMISVKPEHLTLRAAFGTSVAGSITVTSTSAGTLIVRLSASPPDNIDIAIEGSTCTIAGDNVLASGASCTVLVRYTGVEFLGPRSTATLLVTASDPQTGELLDSDVVKITGKSP